MKNMGPFQHMARAYTERGGNAVTFLFKQMHPDMRINMTYIYNHIILLYLCSRQSTNSVINYLFKLKFKG